MSYDSTEDYTPEELEAMFRELSERRTVIQREMSELEDELQFIEPDINDIEARLTGRTP